MKNAILGLLSMLSLSLGAMVYHLHNQLGKEAEVAEYVIVITPDGPIFGRAPDTLDVEGTLSSLTEFIKGQANKPSQSKTNLEAE